MRCHPQSLVVGLGLCFVTTLAFSASRSEAPFTLAGHQDLAPPSGASDPTILSHEGSGPEDSFIVPGLAPYMKLPTLGDERLTWLSGGNHPNHKWVEFKIEDGSRLLIVHEDSTYGTIRMDFSLDLDLGRIEVSMVRSAGISQTESLSLPAYDTAVRERLSYVGALYQMAAIVAKVAEGNDLGYVVLPPRPELLETKAFLLELMRRCGM